MSGSTCWLRGIVSTNAVSHAVGRFDLIMRNSSDRRSEERLAEFRMRDLSYLYVRTAADQAFQQLPAVQMGDMRLILLQHHLRRQIRKNAAISAVFGRPA